MARSTDVRTLERTTRLSDHAITRESDLPPSSLDASAANGREAVSTPAVEAPSRPARHAFRATAQRRAALAIAVDVAMLAVANLLYLAAEGTSFSLKLLVAFDAIVIGFLFMWRAYSPRLRLDFLDDIGKVVTAAAVATMSVIAIAAMFLPAEVPDAYRAVELWAFASLTLAAGRVVSKRTPFLGARNGSRSAATIVVGAGHVGRLTVNRLLEHPELGLRPIAFLDAEPLEIEHKPLQLPVLGTSRDLEHIVATTGVDCVVIAFSSDSHDATLRVLDECERLGIRALVVPRLFERVPSRLEVTHVGGLPLLEMHPTSPRSIQFAIKYALDRAIAAACLFVLSPLLVFIAAATALSLGRPIFYRQDRVSLDGRHFEILKFRTMRMPSEHDGGSEFDPEVAPGGVEGADRRTRLGAFLRKWSLDELPQLINVLKGEMSLVGPRPERPEYVEYFREHVRRYDSRLRTKAGITGWAQIHRLRGRTSIADRVEWDNYYIENFSLWLDLKILLLTIPEALKGRAD